MARGWLCGFIARCVQSPSGKRSANAFQRTRDDVDVVLRGNYHARAEAFAVRGRRGCADAQGPPSEKCRDGRGRANAGCDSHSGGVVCTGSQFMKGVLAMLRWVALLCGVMTVCVVGRSAWSQDRPFVLADAGGAADIVVCGQLPEFLRLAAQDLAEDCARITGRRPRIVSRWEDCRADMVVLLVSGEQPESLKLLRDTGVEPTRKPGQWEAYHVRTAGNPALPGKRLLVIEGSDHRGAMFGLYAFCERYLKVDPFYFWADRPPQKRDTLAWDQVEIACGEPTFRYRGWFINDEDLLTEWQGSGGERRIAYPYYHQVVPASVSDRVFEAMVRAQFNLVIPASFVDIRNPAEERLIADAVRRGLMVSQHHVEPLGVSAFGFDNYWKSRGRNVPYSFVRCRNEFEEIWRDSVRRWARYPGVVWQLGLRGIADRPVWTSDPAVPADPAARGKLISEAMALQWKIIREIDPRPQPPATTTLWMEGADLHVRGRLSFPPGVMVVFADNSPGWQWQDDFFRVVREPSRSYGVYYHHALWNQGPHLIQAVPPQRTHRLMALAVEKNSHAYAMLNVANVREFVLGLHASAEMLRRMEGFDPEQFMRRWAGERFGPAAEKALEAYRLYFASFEAGSGRRGLLDGELVAAGSRVYSQILKQASEGAKLETPQRVRELLAGVERQHAALQKAGANIQEILEMLSGNERQFFETNFVAHYRIAAGLLEWVASACRASLALDQGDLHAAARHLADGRKAMDLVRSGQALCSRGRWEHWYRGDRKMNLAAAEKLLRQASAAVDSRSGQLQKTP